ncbi:hypothetical protein DS891_07085 [Pseudoalteromonas sp. JC28]|uniref:hypothetical protein n=1 Tax=Pseudoalteromonas sp. JC28 TaxID=2267617 RepID=UPI001574CE42|nr:hypothetical protein [Pseudoalteromonas sp. JC28]NSY33362.1 hypothetical protein [Pseudoalteromonas sp. JC28]
MSLTKIIKKLDNFQESIKENLEPFKNPKHNFDDNFKNITSNIAAIPNVIFKASSRINTPVNVSSIDYQKLAVLNEKKELLIKREVIINDHRKNVELSLEHDETVVDVYKDTLIKIRKIDTRLKELDFTINETFETDQEIHFGTVKEPVLPTLETIDLDVSSSHESNTVTVNVIENEKSERIVHQVSAGDYYIKANVREHDITISDTPETFIQLNVASETIKTVEHVHNPIKDVLIDDPVLVVDDTFKDFKMSEHQVIIPNNELNIKPVNINFDLELPENENEYQVNMYEPVHNSFIIENEPINIELESSNTLSKLEETLINIQTILETINNSSSRVLNVELETFVSVPVEQDERILFMYENISELSGLVVKNLNDNHSQREETLKLLFDLQLPDDPTSDERKGDKQGLNFEIDSFKRKHLRNFKNWFKKMFSKIARGFKSMTSKVIKSVSKTFKSMFKGVTRTLGRTMIRSVPKIIARFSPHVLIAATIGSGLIDGFKEWKKSGDIVETLTAFYGGMWDFISFGFIGRDEVESIRDKALSVLDTLKESFHSFIDILADLPDIIMNWGESLFTTDKVTTDVLNVDPIKLKIEPKVFLDEQKYSDNFENVQPIQNDKLKIREELNSVYMIKSGSKDSLVMSQENYKKVTSRIIKGDEDINSFTMRNKVKNTINGELISFASLPNVNNPDVINL